MFFGQIWSENLEFFKLTETSYKGTLLYAYYHFNVDFFKIFVNHIFWANLVPKSDIVPIDWNLAFVCIINIIC